VSDEATAAQPEPATLTMPAKIGRGLLILFGVAAVVFGATGSGFLLIAGVLALAGVVAITVKRRRHRRHARAPEGPAGTEHTVLPDVLMIAGTLPALALWWLVIPAILALLVIGGIIGTGPRRRAAQAV
jgi:hypothetical protein